jgi:tetraacyldisaccharide 4'-kinase
MRRLQLSPEAIWYSRAPEARMLSAALAPLGWLYCAVVRLRATAFRLGWLPSRDVGVPVIVVGNLTVGGTGKTPLVRWLASHLTALGLRPGIAARGYGAARTDSAPVELVPADGCPIVYGDEPVLLAADGTVPVAVGRDRVAVADALMRQRNCDVVLTDDGLQHYQLRRRVEILVIDGSRGFGNGRCLPAGPLRESVARAKRADLQIATGGGLSGMPAMALVPEYARNLADEGRICPLADFSGRRVIAVAGIGNPERFFRMLRDLGIEIQARAYPDHHPFSAADIVSWGEGPVLMTEKDAVKCRRLRPAAEHWSVPVTAAPEPAFVAALNGLLRNRGILANATAAAGYRGERSSSMARP